LPLNPFKLDEAPAPAPELLVLEPARKRPCSEGFTRIQLKPLKFSRKSYAELQNFIFDLENRFYRYFEYFEDDSERVSYAGEVLDNSNKTRWRNHVRTHYCGDITAAT
jgi:hypothetical protein